MANIVSQGFLTRNSIEYLTDISRIKYYRFNTLQNPLAYKQGQNFIPIDLSAVKNSSTAGAKNIWLRDKNIVSLGIKQADDAYKCIGLRPDEDQSGSEQLEWSIESIEKNGKTQVIDLSQKIDLLPTVQNIGPMFVQSTRQRNRMMLPMTNADEGFRIALRLHLTGLTVSYREDLDEYWIYNVNGKFRFRLGKPKIIGYENNYYDPIVLDGQWVKHSLVDNQDGTYTYIKEPGADFVPSELPSSFWIDADTIYSETSDGYVGNSKIDTWANVHDATEGSSSLDTGAYMAVMIQASYASGEYTIIRSFFYYDLAGFSGTATACSHYVMGYLRNAQNVIAQQGTQSSTLIVDDFDSFTGTSFGANTTWATDSYNSIVFNATGLSYVNSVVGSTAKICLREQDYDYGNTAPTSTYIGSGGYFADQENTDYDPYLYITGLSGSSGWTGKIMGITNPAKIMGIDVANILKVGGL